MALVSVHDLARRASSDGTGATPPAPGTTSPPARRVTRRTWRDPRLAVGLALVAASALAGGRLLAVADDRVEVWSTATSLPAGAPVTAGDLEPAVLRPGDTGLLDRYLPASAPPPTGSVLLRPVGAGELLPRAAVGAAPREQRVEVPVAVAPEAVASTVGVGAVVDVWVSPDRTAGEADATGGSARARLVFDDVTVVEAGRPESGLGPASVRRLVVAIPPDAEDLAEGLTALGSGSVVVVRQR